MGNPVIPDAATAEPAAETVPSGGRRTPSLAVNAVPARHYGQWVAAVIVVALLVMLGIALYQNPNIDHPTITSYLTSETILDGLVVTIKLTVLSALVGLVLGVLLAVFRLSSNRILRAASWFYVWAFRGTPLLVQILIWGNFGLLFKHLAIGIPFTHIIWFQVDTNTVLTGFVASILGLGLNESAYMAEVVRGGILAIDPGQAEAARAMGMNRRLTMWRIVLPQAARVIIPPMGNQVINLLKASSLVSVIAGGDLLTAAQNISAANLRVIEMLLVATFWYFVIISVTSVGQFFLERRLARKQVL
jgi:polar amino acid transport system permease protein